MEEILAPEQYAKNGKIHEHGSDVVEFAIKLAGHAGAVPVWMPVDAKFPVEDYSRLLDAQERAGTIGADEPAKLLETGIKKSCQRYISKVSGST